MSGDPRRVELIGLEGPLEAVGAVSAALAAAGRALVLVGGVAVMARMGGAHRATTDADTTIDAPLEGAASADVLVSAGVAEFDPAPQRVLVGGVAVDCMDTVPVDDLEGFTDKEALFLGGHRFACETGEPLVLVSGAVELSIPVASVAGLVVTKLHAARYRRRPEKRGSDRSDLLRLLDTDAEGVATDLQAREGPVGERLVGLVRSGLGAVFLDRPAEVRRWMLEIGEDVSEARIVAVVTAFLAVLEGPGRSA